MKIPNQSRVQSPESRVQRRRTADCGLRTVDCGSGFTMIEIAISLAIIGIALVSIVGILPIGMRTQRDNREETIINQDATVLMEAIRGGSRGLDDLTNYVYAITNYWTLYNPNGSVFQTNVNGYTYSASQITWPPPLATTFFPITNGFRIIGLLSTPEYLDVNGSPTNNLSSGGYSNHVVANVRSISGAAVEKPPQDNAILQQDSFSYRVVCVNAPVAMDTNRVSGQPFNEQIYNRQLAANRHDVRLGFVWPLLPNGAVPQQHFNQTFRTQVAGQVVTNMIAGNILYFCSPQSFVAAP